MSKDLKDRCSFCGLHKDVAKKQKIVMIESAKTDKLICRNCIQFLRDVMLAERKNKMDGVRPPDIYRID